MSRTTLFSSSITSAAAKTATGLASLAMITTLSACGSSQTAATSPSSAPSSTTTASGSASEASKASVGLELQDAYAKAEKASGEMAMSAVFGTLNNASGAEITVVKATSDVASAVELHEVVMDGQARKMQPKPGGFLVPAGGSVELKPGGFHIMLMGLQRDIRPGDTVTVALELSTGSTLTVDAIGRDMANAQESYRPEVSPSPK